MKVSKSPKYRFGQLMSSRPANQLMIVSIVLVLVIAIAAVFSIWHGSNKNLWTWFGSFFSPVPMYSSDTSCGGIRFAYFLFYLFGTIVLSGVIIAIFTNIIRTAGDRYTNGTAHYKFKGHILFLGYDEMMMGTLKHELDKEKDCDVVVAVPNDAAKIRNIIYQNIPNELSGRVIVIQAVRTKQDDLKNAAYVKTAKRIYIIGQADEDTHDANNLKSLGLVIELFMDSQQMPLCMYYMRNHATFSLMQRQGIKAEYLIGSNASSDNKKIEEYHGKYCEPFNFHESAARRLLFNLNDYDNTLKLDWHNPKENMTSSPDLQPHLVIVGMTEMGTALAKAALMSTHYPNKKLKVTFVDDNAYNEMLFFIGRYDALFENCKYEFKNLNDPSKDETHNPKEKDFLDIEFEFIQSNVAHPKLKEMILQWAQDKDHELLTIVACMNDAPKNMAFVLYLTRPVLDRVPVWVYQKNNTGMDPFLDHEIYKQVRVFSLLDMSIPIPGEAMEYELAKKVAHTYDVLYGSESDWSEKSATERWSSLYNALSIIVKLRLAGIELRLSETKKQLETFNMFDKKPMDSVSLNEEQENLFACTEHNRWNIEKLMTGFVPTTEEQHQNILSGNMSAKELKKNFIHDDIRPFEELSKGEQEKDFTLTRALINMINNN